MFTTYDKAIVAIVMGVCFLLNSWFHISIPGFITADNVTQVLGILTPILVYVFPNKATLQQKTETLSSAGVAKPATVAKTLP